MRVFLSKFVIYFHVDFLTETLNIGNYSGISRYLSCRFTRLILIHHVALGHFCTNHVGAFKIHRQRWYLLTAQHAAYKLNDYFSLSMETVHYSRS